MKFSSVPWKTIEIQIATNVKWVWKFSGAILKSFNIIFLENMNNNKKLLLFFPLNFCFWLITIFITLEHKLERNSQMIAILHDWQCYFILK
jgi:hypothetical protein